AILAVETVVAWIAVSFLYGPPTLSVTIAALTGLLFAAPLNFSIGNLISIYAPKKVDYSSFRNQKPSQMGVLISLGVQLFVVGVGAFVFWFAPHKGNFWIAAAILLALAGISITAYKLTLDRMDGLALDRQE